MNCVCGFGQTDSLEGWIKLEVSGSTGYECISVKRKGPVQIYACPKCGTVRVSEKNLLILNPVKSGGV